MHGAQGGVHTACLTLIRVIYHGGFMINLLMLECWPIWRFPCVRHPVGSWDSHRVEVGEEPDAVGRSRVHGELQEGFHVQVGLDHRGGPQKRGDRPRPVDASYGHTEREEQTQNKRRNNSCRHLA